MGVVIGLADMNGLCRGGLDGGAASLGGKIGVEFYTKDRVSYLHDQADAKQEKAFG